MNDEGSARARSFTWSVSGLRWAMAGVVAVCLQGCPPETPLPPGPVVVQPTAPAPGLQVEVESVEIPADLRPVLTLVVSDDLGNIVALRELTDLRVAMAYLDDAPGGGGATRFVNYTPRISGGVVQATSDPARLNGTTQLADGRLRYRFQTALPADFDPSATHQIGIQARRRFAVDQLVYPAEAISRFRPDNVMPSITREVVSTESCNQCHTRLEAHGGVRREVQHCIVCHTPQTFDGGSGRSLDFAEMIHKIHRGHDLPSVLDGEPYVLGGDDFSDVVMPQDLRNCQVCHSNAPHADVYLTQPTLAGCVSCHDRTWFGNQDLVPAGFTMHVGGQHVDDSLCSRCHTPTAPGPSPIFEAHMRPTDSPAAPGLSFQILRADVLPQEGTGGRLRIRFSARDKNGVPYADLTALNAAGATYAYPAPEFERAVREPIVGGGGPRGTLTNNNNGTFDYTFAAPLPNLPGESFAAAMDGRVAFTFRGANYNQGTENNAYTLFTLDGSTPTPRRPIVADSKCNACHGEIRMHGESRVGVEFCIMCHNSTATDAARRPLDQLPPETINFKDMVHRIHRGEDLVNGYTAYGFGNVAHDYSHVRFPGRLQECSICHIAGSEHLPLPDEALSTLVVHDGEVVRDIPPERAACTNCHDHLLSNIHAVLNTGPNQAESCAVCHGPGAAFSVDRVHRLAP